MRRLANFIVFAAVSTVASRIASDTMSTAWANLKEDSEESSNS